MSSPEARGLSPDTPLDRDPDVDYYIPGPDPDHDRQRAEADRDAYQWDWAEAIREDRARDDERDAAERDAREVAGPTDRPGVIERAADADPLRAIDQEAARDRAERADPDTARMVDNRDRHAAAGEFREADSYQRLIDSVRTPPQERQGRTRAVEHIGGRQLAFQMRDGSGRFLPAPTRGGRQR